MANLQKNLPARIFPTECNYFKGTPARDFFLSLVVPFKKTKLASLINTENFLDYKDDFGEIFVMVMVTLELTQDTGSAIYTGSQVKKIKLFLIHFGPI
jgi:hypothetical protein